MRKIEILPDLFFISKGDAEIDGVPVTLDYNKPDDPKVLFQFKFELKLITGFSKRKSNE
jgi:hypothetical protein